MAARRLTLVDTTKTSSWDDWAQGFRSDGIPNMNCPGQDDHATCSSSRCSTSRATWTVQQRHGTPRTRAAEQLAVQVLRRHAQLEPGAAGSLRRHVPVPERDRPQSRRPGKPTGTNCTHLHARSGLHRSVSRSALPMLPAGKYVVEVVVPPGYELVKEEDKNILIGDNYIAPVTQQFAGLGNIFILPDQAAVAAAYNANNPQNPTTDLGVPAAARR